MEMTDLSQIPMDLFGIWRGSPWIEALLQQNAIIRLAALQLLIAVHVSVVAGAP
jgi:hypothetical protein